MKPKIRDVCGAKCWQRAENTRTRTLQGGVGTRKRRVDENYFNVCTYTYLVGTTFPQKYFESVKRLNVQALQGEKLGRYLGTFFSSFFFVERLQQFQNYLQECEKC